jgi:SRSO17 transposase
MAAEDMLADASWRTISWRTGTKGKLKARFAAIRVRVADGPPQRIKDKGQQHLPGDEAWLIGEHRTSGEKKYYRANLPARRTCVPWLPLSRHDGYASKPVSS